MDEDGWRENIKQVQWRCVDLNELLDYVEMVRDAQFCEISTMPLELNNEVKIESDLIASEDRAFVVMIFGIMLYIWTIGYFTQKIPCLFML